MICDNCGKDYNVTRFVDNTFIEYECASCGASLVVNIHDITDRPQHVSMCGYIHRCMNCNSISYEVGVGKYMCGKCGFEWEVIDCGF